MQRQSPSPKSTEPAPSRLPPAALRRIVLEQSKRANVGHIGSALSIADILAALYGAILSLPDPDDPERDRFILSKGHAALAIYAPDESEAPRPNSDYAFTKAAQTLYCRFAAERHGAHIPTLRLYSVFGPFEEPTRLIPTLGVLGLRRRLPPSADAVAVARNVLRITDEPEWSTMPNRSWDTTTWVSNPSRARNELGWRAKVGFEEGFRRLVEWLRDDPKRLELYDQYPS